MLRSLRFHWTPGTPFLFAGAGFFVIIGIFCGSALWGDCIFVGLGMMFAALLFSLRGMTQPANEVVPSKAGTPRWMMISFCIALAAHPLISHEVFRQVPGDVIDCYTFQRDGAEKLVHGTNPYGTTTPNRYTPDASLRFYGTQVIQGNLILEGFPYTPITLLWDVPGYLTGDTRWSFVAATMLSGIFLFAIRPGMRSFLLSLFLLLDPLTFFIESRCWTEPLGLMFLTISMFAAVHRKWWLPIPLGLLLVSKQYNFLMLPFVIWFVLPFAWRAYAKLTAWTIVVGAATFAPFAWKHIWALWHDLVLFHIAMPFREDALTLSVPFHWVLKFSGPLVLAFVAWSCIGIRARRKAMFAAGYATVLLIFLVTNKQAFDNYYFLVAHAFLLASVCLVDVPFWDVARLGEEPPSC